MRGAKLIISVFIHTILILLISYSASGETSEADWPAPVIDSEKYSLLVFNILEYETARSNPSLNWDIGGWYGGDINRLWIKTQGSSTISNSKSAEADLQILYGRLMTAFFDAQIGLRLDQAWVDKQNSTSRISVVVGTEGLALYFFQLEAALFLSDAGQISGRFSVSKDFLLTQKAIVQARLETNAAATRSSEFEKGQGINDISPGIRIRYEFRREFAPYIGLSQSNLFGETADYRTSKGGESSELSAVAGFRMWY